MNGWVEAEVDPAIVLERKKISAQDFYSKVDDQCWKIFRET